MDFKNGKKTSVLVETFNVGEGEDVIRSEIAFYIWMDGEWQFILPDYVEGIKCIVEDEQIDGRYLVQIDKRYDLDYIMKEVETLIKINSGEIDG